MEFTPRNVIARIARIKTRFDQQQVKNKAKHFFLKFYLPQN